MENKSNSQFTFKINCLLFKLTVFILLVHNMILPEILNDTICPSEASIDWSQ